MPQQAHARIDPFVNAYKGLFISALKWSDLDALWGRMRQNNSARTLVEETYQD